MSSSSESGSFRKCRSVTKASHELEKRHKNFKSSPIHSGIFPLIQDNFLEDEEALTIRYYSSTLPANFTGSATLKVYFHLCRMNLHCLFFIFVKKIMSTTGNTIPEVQ